MNLPRRFAESDCSVLGCDGSSSPATPQESAATSALRGRVVDDNLDVGEMPLELLQLGGHAARVCCDGPAALVFAGRLGL